MLQSRPDPEKERHMNYSGRKISGVFAVATLAGLLAGCAGNGTLPAEKIVAGEKSIEVAKASSAIVSAPVELKSAEDKLAAARAAMNEKEYEQAARLAEQAQIDADYARAKASTAKSKKAADDMRARVKALKQEVEQMQVK
jgi:hypothetical protein